MSARDFADLSRERVDDDLHGDEMRRRAIERADRASEWAGPDFMSWPAGEIEVRPAVRNDAEAIAPMRGVLIGVAIGLGFWASVLAFCAVIA
mgnify:CR=1 FL=1